MILLSAYVLLVLPVAVWNQNTRTGFIVAVMLFAVGGGLTAELMTKLFSRAAGQPLISSNLPEYGRALYWCGWIAVLVGGAVGIWAAAAGVGSVRAQVGLTEADGQIGALSSLVRDWGVIGLGLLIAAYVGGSCTRSEVVVGSVVVVGSQAVESYFTALTSPLFGLIVVVAILFVVFGVIGIRTSIALTMLVLVVWPIVYDVRNQVRLDAGVRVSQEVGAFDRLRFDQQIALAEQLPVPVNVDQPDFFEVLRYGFIPRVLDPQRPTLSTGVTLNVLLGGSNQSAVSFLPPTTIYVLQGPVFLFAWYTGIGWFVYFVWRDGRRLTATRVTIFTLLIAGPLSWFATYPDSFIGAIQSFVSSVPLLVSLHIAKAVRARRDGRGLRSRSPRMG